MLSAKSVVAVCLLGAAAFGLPQQPLPVGGAGQFSSSGVDPTSINNQQQQFQVISTTTAATTPSSSSTPSFSSSFPSPASSSAPVAKDEHDESQFCYTEETCGPQHWPGVCHEGKRQSPIVLSKTNAQLLKTPLKFRKYNGVGDFHLTVNGIHEKIPTFKTKLNGDAYIEGGPIPEGIRYYFNQTHFHWGKNSNEGAEHQMDNGKKYVGEAHFVHFHESYGFDMPPGEDAITVVGFFLELVEQDNPKMSSLINLIRDAHDAGFIHAQNEEELNKFQSNATFDQILPDNYDKAAPYFSYEGSLTTPPCTETVKWIVMEDTIKISNNQIQSYFRDHVQNPGRQSTFRPVQPLNGRAIYYYTQSNEVDSDHHTNVTGSTYHFGANPLASLTAANPLNGAAQGGNNTTTHNSGNSISFSLLTTLIATLLSALVLF